MRPPVKGIGVFALMKPWKRLLDVFIEVVIAVALVTGGIVYVVSHPRNSLDWGRIALVGNTVVVFGFLIAGFRLAWRKLVFWTAIAVLLLGHLVVYLFVLGHTHDFPLAYYVVLNSIELALFSTILRKLVTTNTEVRK